MSCGYVPKNILYGLLLLSVQARVLAAASKMFEIFKINEIKLNLEVLQKVGI